MAEGRVGAFASLFERDVDPDGGVVPADGVHEHDHEHDEHDRDPRAVGEVEHRGDEQDRSRADQRDDVENSPAEEFPPLPRLRRELATRAGPLDHGALAQHDRGEDTHDVHVHESLDACALTQSR